MRTVKVANQTLVARKQTRDRGHREWCDAEDAPGNVHRLPQRSAQRHVYAMVVAWRQVHGDKAAVAVWRGSRLVAPKQFNRAVVLSLGLEDASVNDDASLADAPIRRRQQRLRVGVAAARIGAQFAREERIEMLIRERVRLGGFGHVDGVLAHDRADQPVLPRREGPARGPVNNPRQHAVRQCVLQENLEIHRRSIGNVRWARRCPVYWQPLR